jgi:hypothetical protein
VDLEELLARATAELQTAEAEYQAAQKRVDELRTMQDGMRLAMKRYGPAEASAPRAVLGMQGASHGDVGASNASAEPPLRDTTHGDVAASNASAEPPLRDTTHGDVAASNASAEPPLRDTTHGDVAAPRKTTRSSRRTQRRPPKRSKPQVHQSDVCMTVLTEVGGEASTIVIRERLMREGHDYDPEQVRSALAYLKRKGLVVSVEPGRWALAPDHAVAARNGAAVRNDAGRTY